MSECYSIVVPYLCQYKLLMLTQSVRRHHSPWLFSSSSFPFSVSWKAGLMNVSPGPVLLRMARWIQKKVRYRKMGNAMSPIALAKKCFQKYSCCALHSQREPHWRKTSIYHAMTLLDVKDIPEIDEDRNANSYNCQDAIDFGSPGAGHECPCC